jgi:hypothetical protein
VVCEVRDRGEVRFDEVMSRCEYGGSGRRKRYVIRWKGTRWEIESDVVVDATQCDSGREDGRFEVRCAGGSEGGHCRRMFLGLYWFDVEGVDSISTSAAGRRRSVKAMLPCNVMIT